MPRVLSEDAARKLWCPRAVAAGMNISAHNRASNGSPATGTRCIASECMAWEPTNIADSKGYCVSLQGN